MQGMLENGASTHTHGDRTTLMYTLISARPPQQGQKILHLDKKILTSNIILKSQKKIFKILKIGF